MDLGGLASALLTLHQIWIGEAIGLFLAPFVHENIAIVSAAALVTAGRVPVWLAAASLYGGMAASDLGLYGLGALARTNPRARELFLGRGSYRLASFMRDYIGPTVIIARLVPGMIFPSYVACGWLGLSFKRFVVFCLASAAVYLPIAFTLALEFGKLATVRLGEWSWVGLAIPLLSAGLIGSKLLARRDRAQDDGSVRGENREGQDGCIPVRYAAQVRKTNESQASLEQWLPRSRRAYSRFEFWPAAIFYAPMVAYFIWQSLLHRSISVPAIANPTMENGGLWGESKLRLFESMTPQAKHWLAPYVSIVRGPANESGDDATRLAGLVNRAGIGYPFVAKPDIGCKGNGVRIIRNGEELCRYVNAFPVGARLIVQKLAEEAGEAGIFYVRQPDDESGRIISLTLKFVPFVRGDGISTLAQLIRADIRAGRIAEVYLRRLTDRADLIPGRDERVPLLFVGNHCKGAIFRDGAAFITPELTRQIDGIAKAIPEFYFGRFDVRFSSLAGLKAGRDFTLIEYNGGGSEATHIWDADMTLRGAYRDLFQQLRLVFEIGAANRARGYRPDRWSRIIGAWFRQARLMRSYPANE